MMMMMMIMIIVESWYLFAPKYEMNDEEEWKGRMDSG